MLVLVAVQLSVPGLYRPPVFKKLLLSVPPQTIISLPVHTAVCWSRAAGALVVLVAVQLSSVRPTEGTELSNWPELKESPAMALTPAHSTGPRGRALATQDV